jgi:hypothetical protein
MELVDQAVLARQRGHAEAVIELSRAAFAKERAAADLVANQDSSSFRRNLFGTH